MMHHQRTPVAFDAVVVTAPNERSARAYAVELAARIPRRYCRRRDGGEVLVLAASDPAGARVGSGGGTLNALSELRAALRSGASSRDLGDVAVLMVHSGGDSQRSPTNSVCGKAWSALNSSSSAGPDKDDADADADEGESIINTPLDLLMEQLLPLFHDVPKGSMVVASSDVLLILPRDRPRPDWAAVRGVVGLATHVPAELGPNHGAYVVASAEDDERASPSSLRPVRRYLQKAPLAALRAEGAVTLAGRGGEEMVAIDTGVICFAPDAAAALAGLLDEAPFDRCTARGLAEGGGGAPPLRLELYSDILCALGGGMGKGREEYLRMEGAPAVAAADLLAARKRLWSLFNPLSFAALAPPGARFGHLGTTAELMEMMTLKMPAFAGAFQLRRRVGAFLPSEQEGPPAAAVVLNSLVEKGTSLSLGQDAVVEHSWFCGGRVEVGAGALVSGIAFAGCGGDLKGAFWLGMVGLGFDCSQHRFCYSIKCPHAYLPITVRPGMCIQEVRLGDISSTSSGSDTSGISGPAAALGERAYVVTVLHLADPIKAGFGDPKARVWGQPWTVVMHALGLSFPEAIWPDAEDAGAAGASRTLWTAKLFPVLHPSHGADSSSAAWAWMQELGARPPRAEAARAWREAERLSLSDILARAEPGVEFAWRRALEGHVREALAARRAGAWAALKAEVISPPARSGGPLDGAWQPLPVADRRWLVGALEAWVGGELLAAPNAVDGQAASVLAAAFALLARLLAGAAVAAGGGAAGGTGGHGVLSAADGEMDAYDPRWAARWDELLHASSSPEARRRAYQQLRALRREWTTTGAAEGAAHDDDRAGWLAAAAHYEAGSLRLVARQVAASVQPASRAFEPCPRPAPGASVVATAPARIDLGGGWSDTPPISYEVGGEVTNLAIRLVGPAAAAAACGDCSGGSSGRRGRPIGCRVTVLPRDGGPAEAAPAPPQLVLRARQADGTLTEAVLRRVEELAAVPPPGCPTAIVKCALRYCGIVRVAADNNDDDTGCATGDLGAQLQAAVGAGSGGLCVETWSELPTGSGLGTSSILVGTVLAALGRACGRAYTRQGLVHAVLQVEQQLGVGGGWQDQVGGLLGGLQCARSPRGLPLTVECPPPGALSPEARRRLEARLLLVYTGRQRLARHMVRSVLRRYYARCPCVLATVAALVLGAKEARRAVLGTFVWDSFLGGSCDNDDG